MESSPKFTLRIRTEQEQDIDWRVNPDDITFHQALEVISRILPDTTTTAFQYVDEDGEKITVRSDDELKAMFQMFLCDLSDEDIAAGEIQPIVIFPRVGKTPGERNRFDLKIKTQKGRNAKSTSQGVQPLAEPVRPSTQQYAPMVVSPHPGSQQYNYGSQPFHQVSPQHMQLAGNHHRSPQHMQMAGSHHQISPQQMQMVSAHQISPQQMQLASGHQISPKQMQMAGIHQVSPQYRPQSYDAGSQSRADNIKEILTCGRINTDDLQHIELIGSGNGGQVYKSFHLPTQKLMAVKVIKLDVDIEVQKKILLELEILYKCNSVAIIGFYGAFFIENRISICTEFMDGGSLDRYRQIPEEILGRMAVRIVQGLIYMWSLKILHRDIKPSNILVNTSGDVKLCDFGVSTQLVESIAVTYVGTNAYMAPERIKAENYGAPSEIWSLGVTLYELATGKFPFEEERGKIVANPGKMLSDILEGATPVLPLDQFSPQLCDFVAKCMYKDPERRITHPEVLAHPLIQMYVADDNITKVLSAWITTQLQKLMTQSSEHKPS